MGKFIDMTGWVMKEHGIPDSRLTVIGRAEDQVDPKSGKPKVMWKCKCDCSPESYCIVTSGKLRSKSNPTKSCGCIQKERQWTDKEINILTQMYVNNEKIQDIANIIGKSYTAVASKADELGLSKLYIKSNNPKFKAIYQDYDWCYERFINQSMTMQEMAKEAGATLRVIQKWCQEIHGLDARTYKKYKKINDLQRQIIMFGRLGDGHIDRRESQPMYIETHADNQKDYLFWKWSILKDLCTQEPVYYPPEEHNFGTDQKYMCRAHYRLCTRIIDELKSIRSMSISEILLQLNEFGFSLHILDDGSRGETLWEICLAEWTDEEVELYLNICKNKFDINGHRLKDNRYILFDANSSRKIDKIILQNIPNDLDIIQYKIINKHTISKQDYKLEEAI